MSITQIISDFEHLPSSSDPDNFEAETDAFLGEDLPNLKDELNTWAGQANALAAAMNVAVLSIVAAETLTINDLCNIYNDAGTTRIRKASAASGQTYEAHCWVSAGVAMGADASALIGGVITGLSGLTGGAAYLSTNPGQITMTPPSGDGQLVQRIGIAVGATNLIFRPEPGIIL